MEIFNRCGDDYKRATCGKQWKTAGDDVQYCLEVQENTLFVNYQCSSSKRDWVNNLNIFPKKVKIYTDSKGKNVYIWVHRGLWNAFYSAWCTVAQDIDTMIRTSKVKLSNLVFEGHSFGGAMTLFSFLASYKGNSRHIGYIAHTYFMPFVYGETWGAPKCFFGIKTNKILSSIFYHNCVVRNYQCYNDFITKLPPFYLSTPNAIKVGEKFNLFKMLRNAEYYHTCYGEFTDVTRRFEKRY